MKQLWILITRTIKAKVTFIISWRGKRTSRKQKSWKHNQQQRRRRNVNNPRLYWRTKVGKHDQKKNTHDINVWKRFRLASVGDWWGTRGRKHSSRQPQRTPVQFFHGRQRERRRSLRASFPDLFPKKHSKVTERQKVIAKKENSSRRTPKEIVHKLKQQDQTTSQEDMLFRTKQFGHHNPEVLQRTFWWVLSLHFGFKATLPLKMIHKVAKFRCGKLKENRKQDMASVHTKEHLIQPHKPHTTNDAQ